MSRQAQRQQEEGEEDEESAKEQAELWAGSAGNAM
jgi:hypothetical protein